MSRSNAWKTRHRQELSHHRQAEEQHDPSCLSVDADRDGDGNSDDQRGNGQHALQQQRVEEVPVQPRSVSSDLADEHDVLAEPAERRHERCDCEPKREDAELGAAESSRHDDDQREGREFRADLRDATPDRVGEDPRRCLLRRVAPGEGGRLVG